MSEPLLQLYKRRASLVKQLRASLDQLGFAGVVIQSVDGEIRIGNSHITRTTERFDITFPVVIQWNANDPSDEEILIVRSKEHETLDLKVVESERAALREAVHLFVDHLLRLDW